MALNTKGISVGGNISKTLEPGNKVVKINNFKLERKSFMEADNGYELILELETKPIPNFTGFAIDPENPEKGNYAGQIGRVKTSKHFYKDITLENGVVINRDDEILKVIKRLCIVIGKPKYLDEAPEVETIEEFVEQLNASKIFKDRYLNICIAGKEFKNNKGFINYEMFLPKGKLGAVAFEALGVVPSKIIQFNQAEHITKLKQTSMDSFDAPDSITNGMEDPDPFNTDALPGAPEFELPE